MLSLYVFLPTDSAQVGSYHYDAGKEEYKGKKIPAALE